MKRKAAAALSVFLYVTLAAALALMLWALLSPGGRYTDDGFFGGNFVTGAYRVDGGPETELTGTGHAPIGQGRLLTMRGHFTRDIPENRTLMLFIPNCETMLCVNGKAVLSTMRADSSSAVSDSPGYYWQSLVSPGITTGDDIDVTIRNLRPGDNPEAFDEFFDRMYMGSERALLTLMLRKNFLPLLLGAGVAAFGVAMLLASIAGLVFRAEHLKAVAAFGGLALVSGVWIMSERAYLSLLVPFPTFNTVTLLLCQLAIPVFAALYIRNYVTAGSRNMLLACLAADLLSLLCGVALQAAGLVDLQDYIHFGNLLIVVTALCCLAGLGCEVRGRGSKSAYYTLLSILPACVGGVVDILNTYLHFAEANIGFYLGFLFFVIMQVAVVVYFLQENARRSLQLENDLLQSRVTMMLSQIQPHFLYNSLTAIKQLCATDPARAEECVGSFASYLRMNLDSLSKSALIPLRRELTHTEQYLKLEQMRFGDRVKVVYDLRYTGFSLPSLTVQPLVENAVRYGITKKPKGGTITIFADETDTDYVVRVGDDGVGFDQEAKLSGDRSHIGIDNVRSRLAALCGGTLTVESEVGKGTAATILIPKREASEA